MRRLEMAIALRTLMVFLLLPEAYADAATICRGMTVR